MARMVLLERMMNNYTENGQEMDASGRKNGQFVPVCSIFTFPSVIIGRKGSVGSITYAPEGSWVIDTAFYTEILDHNILDLRFLFYSLKRAGLDRHTITTSIPGINRNDIYSHEIFLPLLPEQRRLAAILDEADAIRKARAESLQMLDELVKATFLDMFGDSVSNPKGWEIKPFGRIGDSRLGKMLDKKQFTGKYLKP